MWQHHPSLKNGKEKVEDALKRYLRLEEIKNIWARSDLSEEKALELAYREIHAERRWR